MAAVALSLSCPFKIDHGNEQFSLVRKLCTLSITSQLERPEEVIKICQFPLSLKNKYSQSQNQIRSLYLVPLHATLNSSPRGFGPQPKRNNKIKKKKPKKGDDNNDDDDDDDDEEDEEVEAEAGVIPEVVTNRMISRMGFSVGIPLFIGLLFFPFFYYLKVGLKIDVPTWVPFIVSFFFFGTALLGVSYGIVSSSWDPLREGSLLGWNEAQKNWPVFWQSIWSGGSRNNK